MSKRLRQEERNAVISTFIKGSVAYSYQLDSLISRGLVAKSGIEATKTFAVTIYTLTRRGEHIAKQLLKNRGVNLINCDGCSSCSD